MERTLRVSEQMTLSECGCGRLQFTYGPVTLHFERTEFLLFARDVAHLLTHVAHSRPVSQDHPTCH